MPGIASFDIIPVYGETATTGLPQLTPWMTVTAGGVFPSIDSRVIYGGATQWFSHFNLGAQFSFEGYCLSAFSPGTYYYATISFSDGTTTWTCYSCYLEELTIGRKDMQNGQVVYPIKISGWAEACNTSPLVSEA